jgi:nicotinamide phosphoribosyltransferase
LFKDKLGEDMNKNSLVFQTDSYKVSHWLQFPDGTQKTSYYIESRGGADELLFFGLQAILKKLLVMPTVDDVIGADKFWKEHGVPYFNKQGWLDLIKLGYFPLKIKAIPEGMRVPTKTPLIVIENTVDGFHWLPGWLETRLLQVWYPITVASKIDECKKVIFDNYQRTGDLGGVNFKLHSFGYRGVSSEESAEIGGMAELVSFMGTDTVSGIIGLEKYYNNKDMLGVSIPAAEHSTITSWGKEGEFDAYRNMLKRFGKPNSLVAVVSDSYDLSNAVINGWCGELKQTVMDSGVTLVVRPDSGEPKEVVLRTLNELANGYGYYSNTKGFKVLNLLK